MPLSMPKTNQLEAVLDCIKYFNAPILPIWGVDDLGVCECPKKTRCESPGKHPHRLAPKGVNSATRDIPTIIEWSKSVSNWALRCGEPMHDGGFLAVLDEDPRNGSEESIASLPEIPETNQANSGGLGRHRFLEFSHAPASRTVGPGLDLQGVGKYIVIAPSRHYTGGYYSWELGLGPADIKPAKAPAWLVEGTGEATPRPDRDGETTAEHTVLGELFKLSGRSGPIMPTGQMYVNCPNSDKHTDNRGRGQDASTVVLPPAGGSQFGGFKCLHSNCQNLKWHDILKMMPTEHVKAAQRKYPVLGVAKSVTPTIPPAIVDDDPEGTAILECKQLMACQLTKAGWTPTHDIVNVITALTYDPRWTGVLRYDEFSQILRFAKPPRWFKDDAGKQPSVVWSDEDTTRLDAWMRRAYGIKLSSTELAKAAYIVGRRDAYNPLKEWLETLKWDGTTRVTDWLHRYFGTDDTPYLRACGRKWLISAVARVMTPGCKADHVLILEGGQGVGKSTALRALTCFPLYFSDSPIDIGNKDSFVSLRGKWIIELAELASLSTSESEKSKAFFSSASDSYRPPYGRELIQVPRSCVFAGSTNRGQYLKDDTGGRRYWPVRVGVLDIQGLLEDREQIWAEAVQAFKAGETWWPTFTETPLFEAEQLKREIDDPWEEDVGAWLNSKQAQDSLAASGYISSGDIISKAMRLDTRDADAKTTARIARVMYHLGWKLDRVRGGKNRASVFYPPR